MTRHKCIIPLLFLLLLTACNPWKHERMRQQLADLQARNQADSLLTDLKLAQSLADWFDDHGTANEQLLAYYLLGRTHADRGEAPAAIAAYHDAAERADTTATDCDYRTLSRVYGQAAKLFYQQNLIADQIRSIDRAVEYADRAHDSLTALNMYAHKMVAYDLLGQKDSVLTICNDVYARFSSLGYANVAAQYYGYAIKCYLSKMNYIKAKECMDIYEEKSGLFNDNHDIAKGREVYYHSKGHYFLAIHQYDSAQYYFQKELRDGQDFNNQNMGARGLAELFMETNHPDSAAKYALYAYEMNDSVYARMATAEVEKTQNLYNYNYHQKIAQAEKERAEMAMGNVRILILSIIFLLFAAAVVLLWWKDKRKIEQREYQQLLIQLEKSQTDLLSMRSAMDSINIHQEELEMLIWKKEQDLQQLQSKLSKYQQEDVSNKDTEKRLKSTDSFKNLHRKADLGILLSDAEWQRLNILIIETLPKFQQFITANKYSLNQKEYQACVLLRLHVKPLCVSHLMGVSAATVTKLSKSLLQKLFKSTGSSKELMEKLNLYF